MAWYTAIFLGLVQGLAEFLPISSSGHLLLLQSWFGITDGGLLLTIILHLATLAAVVVVYWRQLLTLLRHPFGPDGRRLLVATVVTCAVVIVAKPWLDQMLTVTTLPYCFLVAGIFLMLPRWCPVKPRAFNMGTAVLMGLAQGVAVVPGLSRSGLTITTGQLAGADKNTAADFSFVMSIPIIIGSLVYELWHGATLVDIGWGNLALAFGAAFVSGIVAIKMLLRLLRQVDLRFFADYLFVLGGCLLLFHVGF